MSEEKLPNDKMVKEKKIIWIYNSKSDLSEEQKGQLTRILSKNTNFKEHTEYLIKCMSRIVNGNVSYYYNSHNLDYYKSGKEIASAILLLRKGKDRNGITISKNPRNKCTISQNLVCVLEKALEDAFNAGFKIMKDNEYAEKYTIKLTIDEAYEKLEKDPAFIWVNMGLDENCESDAEKITHIKENPTQYITGDIVLDYIDFVRKECGTDTESLKRFIDECKNEETQNKQKTPPKVENTKQHAIILSFMKCVEELDTHDYLTICNCFDVLELISNDQKKRWDSVGSKTTYIQSMVKQAHKYAIAETPILT